MSTNSRRLENLLFLLASSSLSLACPGDDGTGDDAGSSSGSNDTTIGDPSTTSGIEPTSGAVDSSGGDSTGVPGTSTGDPSTTSGSDGTSSGGTDGDSTGSTGSTGDESTGTTGGGVTPGEVCPAAGAVFAMCGGMYDYEALCYGLIDDYTTMGMLACADAWLDLFACASALDCAGIAAGPDVSCPSESAAIAADCPAMPPPPPPKP